MWPGMNRAAKSAVRLRRMRERLVMIIQVSKRTEERPLADASDGRLWL
jgi:hypothetical protein